MPDLAFYASQAELYDLAFSWDVENEVAWLLERFGAGTRSVLEPFCGNGRLFPAFARRGVETAGVDLSPEMLAKAAARMTDAGFAAPLLAEADTRAFDLGRRFDAAFCPVNSFGYLHTEDDLARHLACVARHLRPGGRYLVQLGLRDIDDFRPLAVDTTSQWDVETPRGVLRTTWKSGAFDRAKLVERQISRFEWITGPQAGAVGEFEHSIRVRDWNAWSRVIAASPFEEAAAWDGDLPERPPLPVGPAMQGRLLAWHELVVT
jgi:SAM-dependent methyltransferase